MYYFVYELVFRYLENKFKIFFWKLNQINPRVRSANFMQRIVYIPDIVNCVTL